MFSSNQKLIGFFFTFVAFMLLSCSQQKSPVSFDNEFTTQVVAKPSANSKSLEATIKVQNKYTASLLGEDGVVGTATGLDASGNPNILVFVKNKGQGKKIPPTLEGVSVVIQVTGEFKAYKQPAPSITSHPSNATVDEGQTAIFSVEAKRAQSYQWRKNGTNISGANSSSYTTPSTIASDNGAQFDVVVSNSNSSVTSNAATLTVNTTTPEAPLITGHPSNQSAEEGQSATFSVQANGNPLNYQWRKNGADISGANSGSYSTPATVLSDNGNQFDVIVFNTLGSDTSNAATLAVTVVPPPPFDETDHKSIQPTPIKLGTSGGWKSDLANGFCCGGTLGALITDGFTQYILSNYHVFQADIVSGGNGITAQVGDPIIQPGLIDVSCNAAKAQEVATLSSYSFVSPLPSANVDASIAEVIPGMVDPSGAILEIGTIAGQTVSAFIRQKVKKSGRTTGLTRSVVDGLNATVSITYDNECAGGTAFTHTFTGQIVIKNKNKGKTFLGSGDSGALMVEDTSNNPRAVGLLFGGSPIYAVANSIDEVLSHFGSNFSMVGN